MEYSENLHESLKTIAYEAKDAARALSRATAKQRTQALLTIAQIVRARADIILQANGQDVEKARASGLSKAMCDRLDISGARFDGLVRAVEEIAGIEDPVGRVTSHFTHANGLRIQKILQPLGVVLMIYEARPNVTLDAAALCLRSGNAVILRGGSEAHLTNQALALCIQEGLQASDLPEKAVQLVPTQNREAIDVLLTFDEAIDLVIPRGGEALIRRVVEKSRIPVVRHYKGVCHIFVEQSAQVEMALDIIENAKVKRPGVCNAVETVLVEEAIAETFLPLLRQRLSEVELRGCERTCQLIKAVPASSLDFDTEFLDLVLAVRIVPNLEQAIAHIDRHGTKHTAAIVTENTEAAERFLREVDASCVLVNASTRFNDGGELGLGAEMGISTSKVHVYGPMGVQGLCIERFIVQGGGQVRL